MEWNEELQTVVPSKFKLSPFSVLNLPTTLRRLSHRFHHLNNHRSPLLLTRALSSSATAAVAPQPSAAASQDENKGVKASQWKAVIDFKWIRDNKEAVAANIKNRYSNANLELVIELYDKLMSVQKQLELFVPLHVFDPQVFNFHDWSSLFHTSTPCLRSPSI